MRYRLDVRLAVGDVGRRVVIRWRRPAGKNGEEVVITAAGAQAICNLPEGG